MGLTDILDLLTQAWTQSPLVKTISIVLHDRECRFGFQDRTGHRRYYRVDDSVERCVRQALLSRGLQLDRSYEVSAKLDKRTRLVKVTRARDQTEIMIFLYLKTTDELSESMEIRARVFREAGLRCIGYSAEHPLADRIKMTLGRAASIEEFRSVDLDKIAAEINIALMPPISPSASMQLLSMESQPLQNNFDDRPLVAALTNLRKSFKEIRKARNFEQGEQQLIEACESVIAAIPAVRRSLGELTSKIISKLLQKEELFHTRERNVVGVLRNIIGDARAFAMRTSDECATNVAYDLINEWYEEIRRSVHED